MRLTAAAIVMLLLSSLSPAQYQVTLPSAMPPGHQPVTLVATSDLHYPGWDWDDVADATTCFAVAAGGYANLAGIVCDQPFGYSRGDGKSWRGIYQSATGLDVPYYDGLNSALSSTGDNGDGQGSSWRAGRDRILSVMASAADHSVVLSAVGSMRDIAAAFNKNPTLFRQKIKSVYTSGGAVGSPFDANWGSDSNAARALLNAGVPMHVAFCGASGSLPNNGSNYLMDLAAMSNMLDARNPKLGQVNYWAYYGGQEGGFRFKHYTFDTARAPFFGVSILSPSPWAGLNHPPLPASISVAAVTANPQAFFNEPMTKSYSRESFNLTVWDEMHNPPTGSDGSIAPFGIKGMWSTILFVDAAGLRIFQNVADPNQVRVDFADDLGAQWRRVCFFDPAQYTFAGDNFQYALTTEAQANIHMFHWSTATQAEYQGIIDAVDRAMIFSYLPEPATLSLLLAAGLLLGRRRSR